MASTECIALSTKYITSGVHARSQKISFIAEIP